MSIIDESYFIGKISIPTDNNNRVNKLQTYLDNAQKKYLTKALGYELYKLFIAELPVPATQRFIDIIDGSDFTNKTTDKLDHWDGLQNSEKQSFLAYFTYVDFLEGVNATESGNGVTMNKFENSDKISPIEKQVASWNLGLEQYLKLYDFLLANEDNYPEWDFTPIGKTNMFNL
jgi:hypothetical protein